MDAEMARWARRIVGFSYVRTKPRSLPVSQRCRMVSAKTAGSWIRQLVEMVYEVHGRMPAPTGRA